MSGGEKSQTVYIGEYNDYTGRQSLGRILPISVAEDLIGELNKNGGVCDYAFVDPKALQNPNQKGVFDTKRFDKQENL